MGSRNHSNYGSPTNSPYGGGYPQPGQPQHPSLQPKYMSVLAAEMKVYTAEVLKFQDEIRRLKYEIEELKAWKDRETAGLPVEWLPPSLQPALPAPPDPAEAPPALEDYEPARPAWRTVHKRPERKSKNKQKAITGGGPASPSPPPQSPPPQGMGMPGGFAMPSWAQWRPNPVYSPAPVSATPASPLPSSAKPGLFGPPSPGPK
ncbi:hypothetical protein V5O48_000025 [Marasmius crinis-equi]|uniref:Uncharacterized protein n=1 Tax=Marasmius crinis-equi TaxID=585013 RepID=A0ABR3G2B9_9AGAR